MASVLRLRSVTNATLGGPAASGVVLRLGGGTPGPNSVTTTTTTDLVGIFAGDGATVGVVSLSVGLGLDQPTVIAQTRTLFSYFPFAVRLAGFRNFRCSAGASFTMAVNKNAALLVSYDVDDALSSSINSPVDSGPTVAEGDRIEVVFSALSGSPTDFSGTLIFTRLIA